MKRRRSSARACCDCQANPNAAAPTDPAPTPCRHAPAPPPHPPGEGRGLNKYSRQTGAATATAKLHSDTGQTGVATRTAREAQHGRQRARSPSFFSFLGGQQSTALATCNCRRPGPAQGGSRRQTDQKHTVGATWHDPVQQTAARRYLVYRPPTQGTSKPYYSPLKRPLADA